MYSFHFGTLEIGFVLVLNQGITNPFRSEIRKVEINLQMKGEMFVVLVNVCLSTILVTLTKKKYVKAKRFLILSSKIFIIQNEIPLSLLLDIS